MKKIDKLILRTFLGPFLLTFFITLFLIVMQFLWKYIDDLVGKGLEAYIIAELIFFASASFVPLAMPLSVLLSSIMTFGSLGENNELVALKASGIPLLRFMRILIFAVILISIGAFFFSNNILPKANLKFGSLLYDIRKQKPAVSIKEGVFYNGIDGYSIYVQDKDQDNKTVYNILVYDHTDARGDDNLLIAERGKMFTSKDERFLILKLFNGHQYQEIKPKSPKEKSEYEYVNLSFSEYEKIFDLSEFNLKRTDESFFKDHYQMLNISQLESAMDTIKMDIHSRIKTMKRYLKPMFIFKKYNMDSIIEANNIHIPVIDSSKYLKMNSYLDVIPGEEKADAVKKALAIVRNAKGFISVARRDINYQQKYLIRHQIEWHRKFTLSVACLILFFIGAPLGAIIRKGGLGMPLVFSIIFFIVFHVFSITGEKLAEESVWSPVKGMWLSSFILLHVGIFLTLKASSDSRLFSREWYISILKRFRKFRSA